MDEKLGLKILMILALCIIGGSLMYLQQSLENIGYVWVAVGILLGILLDARDL